jgi:hypothetical protein
MIVSHSQQFVFVHVHKTAGESITFSLRRDLAPDDMVIKEDDRGPLHKHSTALELREYLGAEVWERYFTFSFVRHPIDRVVSLYRYVAEQARQLHRPRVVRLLRRQPPPQGDPQRWPGVQAYLATDSFSEFIRHPVLDNAKGMEPQSASLCDETGEIMVDFVGRYERLAPDFAYVRQHLGLAERPLQHLNASTGRGSPGVTISDADRSYLATRYGDDFRRFDYEP